eukprot:TRINITY_DN1336_c0_g1_i1.p1 TRINITY_DN1336_c0_g1~~TRINITY_DN1336_c0_g1_i1.p1  ORF type:complete len:259 (+),score=45.55 TRINITY_DN1336_c0_g1_i1:42-779(+)
MKTNNIITFIGCVIIYCCIAVEGQSSTCPCTPSSLCNPITTVHEKEMFVFQLEDNSWQDYDWNIVTTLAVFGKYDPQMVCKAHSEDARVVFNANFPVDQLTNVSAIEDWATSQVQRIQDNFVDGINLDIEDPLDSSMSPFFTNFFAYITKYIKEQLPYAQITADIAWSPNCIDKRCYDYAAMGEILDFLIVMDYDMRSQIYGPCVASANSPLTLISAGYQNFTNLGMRLDKLVMGCFFFPLKISL